VDNRIEMDRFRTREASEGQKLHTLMPGPGLVMFVRETGSGVKRT